MVRPYNASLDDSSHLWPANPEPAASHDQQMFYWTWAVCVCAFSVTFILILYGAVMTSPAARKLPVNRVFSIIFLGDTLWCFTYGTFHLINLAGAQLVQSTPGCHVVAWVAHYAMWCWGIGGILMAYAVYQMAVASSQARVAPPLSNVVMAKAHGCTLFVTLATMIMFEATDNADEAHAQLWCGAFSYNHWTSPVFVFFYCIPIYAVAPLYFYKAFKIFKSMESAGRKSQNENLVKATKTLNKRALVFVGNLFATAGAFQVYCLLTIVGVQVPVEFVMFAGIIIKAKPAADVMTFLSLPSVRAALKQKANAVMTTASSMTSSQGDN